jgi:hypothetical protein
VRVESRRASNARYRRSPRGRRKHAARQARYRARNQKVTDQGFEVLPLERTLVVAAKTEAAVAFEDAGDEQRDDKQQQSTAGLRCTMCGSELNGWLRDNFLGQSLIRRRWPKRGPPRKR